VKARTAIASRSKKTVTVFHLHQTLQPIKLTPTMINPKTVPCASKYAPPRITPASMAQCGLAVFLALGLSSSLVMFPWLVIAENHRAFQNKSFAWLSAIEEAIGIEVPPPTKIAEGQIAQHLTREETVQRLRWGLTLLVRVGSRGAPLALPLKDAGR
jgi:hypothetical protein